MPHIHDIDYEHVARILRYAVSPPPHSLHTWLPHLTLAQVCGLWHDILQPSLLHTVFVHLSHSHPKFQTNAHIVCARGYHGHADALCIEGDSGGLPGETVDCVLAALEAGAGEWAGVRSVCVSVGGVATEHGGVSVDGGELVEMQRRLRRCLPHVRRLEVAALGGPWGGVGEVLANTYCCQLGFLESCCPLVLSCRQFARDLTHLTLALDSTPTSGNKPLLFPRLSAEPLRRLALSNVPQGYSWAEFIDYDGHNLYFANLTHLSLDFSNDPTDTIHPNHRIAAKTLRYMLHFPKLQHLSIANCPPKSPLFSSQKYFTSVPHISIDGSLASVSHATGLGLQSHKRVGVRLAGAVEGDEDQRIVYRVLNYYFATLEVERKAELTLDVGLDRLDVSKIRWANLTSLVLASVFKVDCLLRLMFALPNVTTLAAYRLDIKLYSLFVGHDFGDDMHDSSKMLTGSSTASWFPQIKLGFYFSYVRNLVSTQKELQRVFRFLPVSAISPVPTTRIKMLALYFDETSPGTLDLKTEILVYILAKVGCLQAAHVDPVFRIPLDLLATHLQPMCPHLADIWVNYIPAGLSKDTKIFV